MREKVSKVMAIVVAFILALGAPTVGVLAEAPGSGGYGERDVYAQGANEPWGAQAFDGRSDSRGDTYAPHLAAAYEYDGGIAPSYAAFAPFADIAVNNWDDLRDAIEPLLPSAVVSIIIENTFATSEAGDPSAITIPAGVSVTLQSDGSWVSFGIPYEITQDTPGNRHFIVYGELTVTDLILCGESLWENNGGVSVGGELDTDPNLNASAVFTLGAGGAARHSHATLGGGVAVFAGTFNLDGGDVYENEATGIDLGGVGGGGVFVGGSGHFSMTDGFVRDSTAQSGGGVYLRNTATFTMLGGVISGNIATEYGGGVYAVHNSGIFMDAIGGTPPAIMGNRAPDGGGLYLVNYMTFSMEDGVISGNKATGPSGQGGGLYVADFVVFTMNGGIIGGDTAEAANTAPYGGGMTIRGWAGTFNMNGGAINGNIATTEGGGINMTDDSIVTITDGTVNNNEAPRGGGIMVSAQGQLYMDGGAISGNNASGTSAAGTNAGSPGAGGGGVFLMNTGVFVMTGGVIGGDTPNTARYGGGVYVTGYTRFTMDLHTDGVTAGTISGNSSTTNGGGVSVYTYAPSGAYVAFTMEAGTIAGNVSGSGGGVHLSGAATFNFADGNISDNQVSANGGGVYANGANVTVNMGAGTVSGNFSTAGTGQGGGVYLNAATFNMTGGVIGGATAADANRANSGGGVYMMGASHFIMTPLTVGGISGTITGNTAGANGGGVYLNSTTAGGLSFTGAVVSNNTADGVGGGIYAATGTPFVINNSAFTNNSALSGGGIYLANLAGLTTAGSTFSGNHAGQYGGAIYTVLFDAGPSAGYAGFVYHSPLAEVTANRPYRNLNIDPNTVFTGNTAGLGAAVPPSNALTATDVPVTGGVSIFGHPINNYDINFFPNITITFAPGDEGDLTGGDPNVDVNIPQSASVDEGDVPAVNPNSGWRFRGWVNLNAADPTALVDPTTAIFTEDTTLTAVYEEATVTVTFETATGGSFDGGVTTTSITVPVGTTLTPADIPDLHPDHGWYHTGWLPTTPLGYFITEDITFTALFEETDPDLVEVVFYPGGHGTLDGGIPEVSILVPRGTVLTAANLPTVFADGGWVHTGWGPVDPIGFVVNDDTEFTATYNPRTPGKVRILFIPGSNGQLADGIPGITIEEDPGDPIDEGDVPPVYPNPGWRFVGWRIWTPTGDGDMVDPTDLNPEEDIILEAVYEPIMVNITYVAEDYGVLEGGETEITVQVPWGTVIAATDLPAVIANTGWIHDGWLPTNPIGYTVTEDVTFTAAFRSASRDLVAVAFLPGDNGALEGGIPGVTIEVEPGTVLTAEDVPEITPNPGWQVTGWMVADSDGMLTDPVGYTVTGNIAFVAVYEQIMIPVRFISGDNGNFAGGNPDFIDYEVPWGTIIENAHIPGVTANTGWAFTNVWESAAFIPDNTFNPMPLAALFAAFAPFFVAYGNGGADDLTGIDPLGHTVTSAIQFTALYQTHSPGNGGNDTPPTFVPPVILPPADTYSPLPYIPWQPRVRAATGDTAPTDPATDPATTDTDTGTDDAPPVLPPTAPMPVSHIHHAYMIGYAEDGTIRPHANITRGEVTTIFFRLITDRHRGELWTQRSPFADVTPQHWFNNPVSTMANGGLFAGLPLGENFYPNQAATRAEFAVMVVNFLGLGDYTAPTVPAASFTDTAGHWAENAINAAYFMGWVHGFDDGTFRPNQPITRAEVAALVNRALGRLPQTPADLLPGMVVWPDNMNQDAWYYLYIQEATNTHYSEKKADGTHETWVRLLPPRDWRRLERPDATPWDLYPY